MVKEGVDDRAVATVLSLPALHRHADSHPPQPYSHHSPTHVDPPPSLFSWRDRTETTASLFLGDGRDADAAYLYLGDIQSITSVCQLSIGREVYSVGREAAKVYLAETRSLTTPHSLSGKNGISHYPIPIPYLYLAERRCTDYILAETAETKYAPLFETRTTLSARNNSLRHLYRDNIPHKHTYYTTVTTSYHLKTPIVIPTLPTDRHSRPSRSPDHQPSVRKRLLRCVAAIPPQTLQTPPSFPTHALSALSVLPPTLSITHPTPLNQSITPHPSSASPSPPHSPLLQPPFKASTPHYHAIDTTSPSY